MTHYSLTPEERTQLSALLDNELPDAERESTLRLLAGSEDARRYLQHLRSLRTLTANTTGGTRRIVAATSPALTGAAIRTAATQYSGGLLGGVGSLLNGWVLAAAASAAILGGVFLAHNNDDPAPLPRSVAAAPASAATSARTASADTASLIIPPLTRTDLLHFAVDGTLPIEARERPRCYLTISAAHGDSVKLTVHSKPPRSIPDADLAEPAISSSLAVLDSLAEAVRTTIVRTPNGLAMREDAPQLRALAVQYLEREPRLPRQIRSRIVVVQRELATIDHELGEPTEASVSTSGAFNTYLAINGTEGDLFMASNGGDDEGDQTFSIVINSAESRFSIRTTAIQHDNQPALAAVEVGVPQQSRALAVVAPRLRQAPTRSAYRAAETPPVPDTITPSTSIQTSSSGSNRYDDIDTGSNALRNQYDIEPPPFLFNLFELDAQDALDNARKDWQSARAHWSQKLRRLDSLMRANGLYILKEHETEISLPAVPPRPVAPVDPVDPSEENEE